MSQDQNRIRKFALSWSDFIPTDHPEAKDFTVNPSGTGFQYNTPPAQATIGQSPIQAAPPMQSPIQAAAPAPKPQPQQAPQFKAPTMPVNTETPFKAPQAPGGSSSQPMVKFTMPPKQAAFEKGFQKRAEEYTKLAFVPQDTDFGSGFITLNRDGGRQWLTSDNPDGWNSYRNFMEHRFHIPKLQLNPEGRAVADEVGKMPWHVGHDGSSNFITDILFGNIRNGSHAVKNALPTPINAPPAGVFGPEAAIKIGK